MHGENDGLPGLVLDRYADTLVLKLYTPAWIPNVLCLQPFGCIANHIIANGVEKKMKEMYPQLNLLFLDADAGISEVNFFNRMHFFVNHAKEGIGVAV